MTNSNSREARPSGTASESWRTPADRDLDRILYASAYRRLGGVTQVLPAGEQPLMHNRLTHSLKVQQVARREAQYLLANTDPEVITLAGGLDPSVAEAAAAAHDLGHPPFGHVAEDELQDILSVNGAEGLPDSFEGNAQTFRIVTKLAIRRDSTPGHVDRLGLDLTYATQAAILKYPWCRGEHKQRGTPESAENYYARKWSAYESERPELEAALRTVPEGHVKSLEAEVMDLADDITYAVHDIEDFFRLGIIPLHELGWVAGHPSPVFDSFWSFAEAEIQTKGEINFVADTARDMFKRVLPLFPSKPFQDDERDRVFLHKFISETVTTLQAGTKLSAAGHLLVPDETRMLLEVLKQLTWFYVIEHPALAALQKGQRVIVSDLVKWCVSWANDFDPDAAGADAAKRNKIVRRRDRELPGRLRAYIAAGQADTHRAPTPPSDAQVRLRAVVDYVASLTEAEAYGLHRRLGGTDPTGLLPLGLAR